MRHNLLMALALTAATSSTFLLAGCAADPILPDKAEEYSREFIKNFGVFDKTHDWNQATRVSVSVNTAKPTDIKIYAMVDGMRYLFSTYLNVNGQETLNVDVPKGTTELIVRANGMDHEVKAGGAVDLASRSRTIIGSESAETTRGGLTWKITQPEILRTVATKTYIATYAEDDKTNLSKGTNSFYFIADGNSHTFYPFYWHTSANHILGIFTVDPANASNITLHDLYYSKTGELTVSTDYRPDIEHYAGNEQRLFTLIGTTVLPTEGHKQVTYHGTGNWWDDYFSGVDKTETKTVKITDPTIFTTPHGYISSIMHTYYGGEEQYLFYETPTEDYIEAGTNKEGNWTPADSGEAYTDAGENVYVKTRGIQYKLDKGTRYGFYIKVKNSGAFTTVDRLLGDNRDYDFIIFSNSERNAVPFHHYDKVTNECIYKHPWTERDWWADSGASDKDKFAYASWGTARMLGREYTLFGFEDWPSDNNGSINFEGADLNDIMFLFAAGEQPSTVVDLKELGNTFEWIIACEDLGTDDFDFNDVVFGVSNPVTDKTTGKKTVDITALAAGGTLPVYLHYKEKVIGEEFHQWFGSNYLSRDVINAKTYSAQGMKYTIEVDNNFSLASGQLVDSDNMGGFKVEVKHSDGSAIISASNPKLDESIGSAPQMLCLPGTWLWPQENICIASVYEPFKKWCENHTENTEWHKTPTTEDYVHRTISTGSGSLSDIGDASHAVQGEIVMPGVTLEVKEITTYDNWSEPTKCYKYAIPTGLLDNATEAVAYIILGGAKHAEVKGMNGNQYTGDIKTNSEWVLTSENISDIKRNNGEFYVYYYSYPENFTPEISLEITK